MANGGLLPGIHAFIIASRFKKKPLPTNLIIFKHISNYFNNSFRLSVLISWT